MDYNTARTSAFNALANKETKDLVKTKMCLYYKVGCPNKNCSFAHSKEELKPSMCRFDKACRKRECWFYHSRDALPTSDELFRQATQGIKFIEEKPKHIVKAEKREIKISEGAKKYLTPFIIEEESDDEDEEMSSTVEITQTMKKMELIEETMVTEEITQVVKSSIDKKKRVQFEALMTIDEMQEVMTYLRSKKMDPTIICLY